MDTELKKKKSAQKVNNGEESSPTFPARAQTCNLLITVSMLYQLSYPNSRHIQMVYNRTFGLLCFSANVWNTFLRHKIMAL